MGTAAEKYARKQVPSPEMARYPASDMIGPGCEPVACSVWAGEDPDTPEVTP
jgi:hypothetical protein